MTYIKEHNIGMLYARDRNMLIDEIFYDSDEYGYFLDVDLEEHVYNSGVKHTRKIGKYSSANISKKIKGDNSAAIVDDEEPSKMYSLRIVYIFITCLTVTFVFDGIGSWIREVIMPKN